MILLDISIRSATIALALLSAVALMLDRDTRPIGWPLLALTVTLACFLQVSGPVVTTLPPPLVSSLRGGAIFIPLAVCWLVVTVFIDTARERWPWLAAAGGAVVFALAGLWWPQLDVLRAAIMLAFFSALLAKAVSTAGEDLVDVRRRLRPAFLSAMAVLGGSISVIELLDDRVAIPQAVPFAQAVAFLALAFAHALWVLKPEPTACLACNVPVTPETPQTDRRAEAVDVSVISALTEALDSGIWRREGLTIADLGQQIGVPEHRLRAVINKRLGFRNFPTFINSYRIAAAKEVLADPANARRTILEVAYDSGFASLGPFNKAFRDQTGESPSEFRRRALDSANSLAVFENSPPVSESARARPH